MHRSGEEEKQERPSVVSLAMAMAGQKLEGHSTEHRPVRPFERRRRAAVARAREI